MKLAAADDDHDDIDDDDVRIFFNQGVGEVCLLVLTFTNCLKIEAKSHWLYFGAFYQELFR